MIVRRATDFPAGYTAITAVDGLGAEMRMDFGVLVLETGGRFEAGETEKEQAYLLLDGELDFRCDRVAVTARRASMLDEKPWTLHCSAGSRVEIRAARRSELVVQRVLNPRRFPADVYGPDEVRSQRFGEGTMSETSTRTVRTIFDAATHELSGMVLGEVVNHPGKWSSYPPHSHAHPEVYHYRMFPPDGFGFGQVGDEVYRMTHRDSLLIPGGVVHPQTAAPGYAMFYVWAIPHLPDNRFGPDSREFDPLHAWVMEEGRKFWPENHAGEIHEA